MTIGEYLEIIADLDAYIAKGGQLLDLPMMKPPPELEQVFADRLGEEMCDRLALFVTRLGNFIPGTKIGTVLTEAEVQTIWRETADPNSTGPAWQ